jgi:hypothetical protein
MSGRIGVMPDDAPPDDDGTARDDARRDDAPRDDDGTARARQRGLVRRGYDTISWAYRSDAGAECSTAMITARIRRQWLLV